MPSSLTADPYGDGELGLDYEEAKRLLLFHGSVKNAVDAYRSSDHK